MKKNNYWWVLLIISINVGIYLIESRNNSIRDIEYLVSIGAFRKQSLNSTFDLYRLFSCQFIHTGFFHIFINMCSIFYVTKELKQYQSSLKSFVVYSGGLIIVAISLFLFGSSNITYLGNSGAISALFSSWLYNSIKQKRKKKLPKKEIETILMIIIFSIIIPGVSPIMHFSGLIAGVIFTLFLSISKRNDKNQMRKF